MIMARVLRRLFSADAMGLMLVFVALQALIYGLSSSLRNTDTRQFLWICLLAALIASGLSKRNWSGIAGSAGMTALGILTVWILGARLASPLLDFGNAALSVLPQIILAIRSKLPIDATAIVDAWLVIAETSNALSARVQTWVLSLSGNVTVNDPLVRNMTWLLILWLIAAWMGWFAARRNAIAALLPSILLLALITSYSEYRIETLWLMVLILLLLMGIWNYRNHTAQWERRRVDYSDSIRYDVTQSVVLLSVVIGLVAFITPSISWREIRDYLRERGKNEVAETLGVRQQQVPVKAVPVQKPSLPREHLLSGGYAQSQQIVMTIRTGELPPLASSVLTAEAPRYYWRSTTYDTYVGEGWVTSSAPGKRYEANTPLIPGLLNGYRALHLDVEMVQPEGKLFWSGILFSANIPIRADWRLRPQASLFADQSALLEADMFLASSESTAYQAEAYVPLVTVEELRAASTEYPEAIRERYLTLPASIPDRVRQLAGELTKDKPLAYDKAKAIETYLRTFPYDLEVPAPPPERDVSDYFLFDLKKGYCDYYATAMVVLARASGLPARFVSGYASGSYDAANAVYVVRELHAHSWAEVYFPEIGWIEFEPTAAQPEIELSPSGEEIVNAPANETATRLLNRFRFETLLYLLSPFAILGLGLLLYFNWIEGWLYLRLAPAAAIEKIYRQLYRWGRPLAGERTKAETAYEFMGKLIDRISAIGGHSRTASYLSRAPQDIQYLTDVYQGTLFAHHTIDTNDARMALRIWKHVRLRLLFARLHIAARRALAPTRRASEFIQGISSR
jgi:transglutaminase-like putative cysteine protease